MGPIMHLMRHFLGEESAESVKDVQNQDVTSKTNISKVF